MRRGWIKSIRKSKSLTFLGVTDGKRDFQVTLHEGFTTIYGEPKIGASFIAVGESCETPAGKPDFKVSDIRIVGASDDTYPIQPKAHSSEFLRTIPELRGRARNVAATMRIRSELGSAIHNFFYKKGFYQYYTPILTMADCEGAGETFDVTSDWMEAKLTVSGQLHGEVGMLALGKIYTFSPCFRAEKSTTKKHLSEFWMIEPEVAFMDLEECIKLARDLIYDALVVVDTLCKDDLAILHGEGTDRIMDLLINPWEVKTYDEICEEFGLTWGHDISTEYEKKIIEKYKVPTFVWKYPKDLKPFYMLKDEKYAYCFDLIFPEVGEVVGGSQREDKYDTLYAAMVEAGLDMDNMQWYLNTRKWGSVPHSGFGLGFDRLLLWITGQDKIHDVIPFPISY